MEDKNTYKKIIQAGKEILGKKDYHETIVEEIAEVAGVSKATIFFYFKTKENLFKEIVLSVIEELNLAIQEILELSLNPVEKLKKIYEKYIELQSNNMQLFISIRKHMLCAEPKIEEVKLRLDEISNKILPLIEEMFEKKLVKTINTKIDIKEIIPSMILMYSSAVSSMIFYYPDKVQEIKEIFWHILLHGILNEDVSIEMLIFND